MSSLKKLDSLLDRILLGWVSTVVRLSWILVLVFVVGSGFCLYYTANNLGVNTNTEEMLSADLPFRINHAHMEQAFPQDARTILVVIESNTPEQSNYVTQRLGDLFHSESQFVKSVYIPGEDEFFKRQALLYEDVDKLDQLALDITRAQPFLGRLARNNSLSEFTSILGQAIGAKAEQRPMNLDTLIVSASQAIQNATNGFSAAMSWQNLMLGENSNFNTNQRFILVRPVFNYAEMVPAEPSFKVVRGIVDKFQRENPGVRIRLTGEVALEHEELESISEDMTIAGIISLILVCLTLLLALRSVQLAIVTVISLVTGLILSAGFATVAVGHLNLISIAFAVLYVGLGVDYALHLCLQYRDYINAKIPVQQAIVESTRTIGPSILLCTVTTAIGFFAFIPTAYIGVSELGIISGVAMFIGLFVTLTLLPALLRLMPVKPCAPTREIIRFPIWFYQIPTKFGRTIRWTTPVLILLALLLIPQVSFDFDPVALRDPNSESVTTFRDLLQAKESSPLTISLLAPDLNNAKEIIARLELLDSVDRVISIASFIPEDQDEKLDIIASLEESLGPAMIKFPALRQESIAQQVSALNKLKLIVGAKISDYTTPEKRQLLLTLHNRLNEFLTRLNSISEEHRKTMLLKLSNNLLANLPIAINNLLSVFLATPVESFDQLPASIYGRWISQKGDYRLQVFPSKDLNQTENLREFVDQVQQIAPNSTDLPVIYAESGKEVLRAFQQALTNAIIAITLITLLVFRSVRLTAFVLLPLFLAGLLTGASTVISGVPFNFANIIAIPLLLGLGVDSAIHVVHRLRHMAQDEKNILQTSTARGVFFSSVTTAVSFTSLAFISHAGTASLGQLLTISIALTLLCTLIILPAFATKFNSN